MIDPLAHRNLAPLAVALLKLFAATGEHMTMPLAQDLNQLAVSDTVAVEIRIAPHLALQHSHID